MMEPRLGAVALVALLAHCTLASDPLAKTKTRSASSSLLALKRIHPELSPVSDKKFFKDDYPSDLRPDAAKHHFDHPFPTIQDSSHFDKDYVRDENDDGGEWAVQTEYDTLRNKLRREKEDVQRALKKLQEEEAELKDKMSKEELAEQKAKALEAEAARIRRDAGIADTDANVTNGEVGAAAGVVEKEVNDLEKCRKELAKVRAQLKKLLEERDQRDATSADLAAKQKAIDDQEVDAEAEEGKLEEEVGKEEGDHREALKSLEEEKKDVVELEAKIEKAAQKLRKFRHDVDKDGGVYRSGAMQPAVKLSSIVFTAAFLVCSLQ